MTYRNFLAFVFILLSFSLAASAKDTEVSTSILKEPYNAKSFSDHVVANFLTTFRGEPINNLNSVYTVDHTGATSATAAVNLDSELNAAYMFSPTFGVGPVLPFQLAPVLGKGFIMGDVGIKALDNQTISYRGFVLNTNLILQAPTSSIAQAHNMAFAVKTTPSVRYDFQGSRFSVGSLSEAKSYVGVTSDRNFKLYAAPYVSYQVSPTVALNVLYEYEIHHNVGDTGMLNFSTWQSDVEPGFIWNITPKVRLNPYLQIFTTNNTISPDRMALGAAFAAALM